MNRLALRWLSLCLLGCAVPVDEPLEEVEHLAVARQELSSFDCHAHQATGYEAGNPFPISVVTIDGELVERNTANAYYFMAKAAAQAGIQIRIVSGFRTMAEQQYLYNCYINCSCNNCNLAAVPGYSNHQSGEALDLNTSASGVYTWLSNHAGAFGFERTVPSEAWHWEYRGPKPLGGPCGTLDAELIEVTSEARPDPTGEADYLVCGGEAFSFQVEMKNIGTARWADLEANAKYVGERVRLLPKGAEVDPLTGLTKLSVLSNVNDNVLPATWGGGAGEPCNDKPGCRRTIFTKEGIAATAPVEPGVYTSLWRLRDFSPHWTEPRAFGPDVEVALRVESCAGAPEVPGQGGTPEDPGAPAGDEPQAALEDASGGCALAAAPSRSWLALLFLLPLIRSARRRRSSR